MRGLLLAVLAFFAFVSDAVAAVHQLQIPHGKGSAVSVGRLEDDSYLFLTAGHNLKGVRSGRVSINRKWYSIQIISAEQNVNAGIDIAAFKVHYSGYIKPTEFAASVPKPGEKLYGYGFALGGPCKTISGRVHDVRGSLVRIKSEREYISGMSGGGIYDDDSKLVAILSGSEGGRGSRFPSYNRGHLIVGKNVRYSQFCFGNT